MCGVPATGYNSYESVHSSTSFSASFIRCLTIEMAISLNIPAILPPGSVRLVEWAPQIPTMSYLELPGPIAAVPHLEDIRPILAEQPSQFVLGMRSAIIEVSGKLLIVSQVLFYAADPKSQVASSPFISPIYDDGPTCTTSSNTFTSCKKLLMRSFSTTCFPQRNETNSLRLGSTHRFKGFHPMLQHQMLYPCTSY